VKVAYLFSRYPAVSHTFCDTEMLAHEEAGLDLEIDVVHPPRNAFRHGHAAKLRAPIFYAPPPPVLKALEARARRERRFPEALVRDHQRRFGPEFKSAERARNALFFAEALTRRGITHLHAHFANRAAHTALLISALSGIPFSFTAHGQDFMADLGSRELLCEMCERAAFVVAVSGYSRDLLAEICSSAAEKVRLIHNGIELRHFPASPAPSNPVPRILSVGRLIPVKGHTHLIAACARLRERGIPFECDIVGDGPLRGILQAEIDAANLGGSVRLTGSLPQEEVFRRLGASDVFALPSIVDSQGATDILPTVVLEAMAAARPVAATRVGGVAELVEDGRTGFMLPPGDAAALADALERLLEHAALRREFGAAGRAKVEHDFRVQASAAALRELFAQHGRVSRAMPAKEQAPRFAYLVAHWPEPALPGLKRELIEMRKRHPRMRIIVARVAPNHVARRDEEPLLADTDFLPDAMVLEAEWLQERGLARLIETWRGDLAISSEEYLMQGRWALGLRKLIAAAGIRHLHVAGSAALPCAWILRKLCGISFSATIESKPARSDVALRQLTAPSEGGRAAQRLEGGLGASFEPDLLAKRPAGWLFPRAPRVLREWSGKLQRWAGAGSS
jgi:glycosyltransferase involved in cell wall biosynthesis